MEKPTYHSCKTRWWHRYASSLSTRRIAIPTYLCMESSYKTVMVIGPPTEIVGGMSSVVTQNLQIESNQFRMDSLPFTVASSDAESIFKRLGRHIRQLFRLRAAIRHTRASIVHIHTCSGFSFFRSSVDMVLSQWLGCRVILHIHGAAFDVFYADTGPVLKKIIAYALSRADCVIALSKGWEQKLHMMAPKAKVHVIENAVKLPAFDSSPVKEEDCHVCRFTLLARMDTWKGIDDLLLSCHQLYLNEVPFELRLAGPPGSAGDADQLLKIIKSLGLTSCVEYIGSVQGSQKDKLLQWADVYVQPSHHEGMPIAVLEALSYGLPVVATCVGAVPEVIEHGKQGILVPAKNPKLFAEAMISLIQDPVRRKKLALAARKLAEDRFSLDRFHHDLLNLYFLVGYGYQIPKSKLTSEVVINQSSRRSSMVNKTNV